MTEVLTNGYINNQPLTDFSDERFYLEEDGIVRFDMDYFEIHFPQEDFISLREALVAVNKLIQLEQARIWTTDPALQALIMTTYTETNQRLSQLKTILENNGCNFDDLLLTQQSFQEEENNRLSLDNQLNE